MKQNLNEFIRDLSEVYDPDSKDTFISVYLSRKWPEKFFKRRIKACRTVLKKDELENFDKTINKINDIISKKKNGNIAIFASDKNNFKKTIDLTVDLENLVVVDSSPYIRPLARIHDEYESFLLVILSSNYAKIFSISLGKIDDTKKLSADIMNRHKKGGWSQTRFNRLRKGAIKNFLSDISNEIKKNSSEKIIIAGPGITKKRFIDMLPKDITKKIVDIIDISIDEEDELLKKSIIKIKDDEEEESNRAVNVLKQEILKNGLAVYGINETIKAVRNGQVEILIIQKDFKLRGWICEHCQVVEKGNKKNCPYCGSITSEVDMIEEILEFAERTDAEIEFTDSEELAELGHVGGILRFK